MQMFIFSTLLAASVFGGCGGDDLQDCSSPLQDLVKQDRRARIGDSCTADEDCGSWDGQPLRCYRQQEHYVYFDGYCSIACSSTHDKCPLGTVCTRRMGKVGEYCMRSCDAQADCREGYFCTVDTDNGYPRVCASCTVHAAVSHDGGWNDPLDLCVEYQTP